MIQKERLKLRTMFLRESVGIKDVVHGLDCSGCCHINSRIICGFQQEWIWKRVYLAALVVVVYQRSLRIGQLVPMVLVVEMGD